MCVCLSKDASNPQRRQPLTYFAPLGFSHFLSPPGLQGPRLGRAAGGVRGLQRLRLRLRSDRLGEVLHHDGESGEHVRLSAALRGSRWVFNGALWPDGGCFRCWSFRGGFLEISDHLFSPNNWK